jgi:steroid 5-alpha reductase family enzyme
MTPPSLIFLLDYPIKLCAITTSLTYVASIITGNVSQVDRLWTFLPTIYTAYWALLPLWPPESEERWRYLVPSVPQRAANLAHDFSPRALLMLGLTVRAVLRSE